MKYKLPVNITKIDMDMYMAQCDSVRATATGDTPEEALDNLHDAIDELIAEYGEKEVFQDVIEKLISSLDKSDPEIGRS